MNFRDIPQYPRSGFCVDVSFTSLASWVEQQKNEYGLDLNPDFQRGHIWTPKQQRAYIEYQLQGGEGGKVLDFNHPGWSGRHSLADGPYVILDGLQRLTAVTRFMSNKLRVFGGLRYCDFTGFLRQVVGLKWRIFELQTREEVLRYYLAMNSGGTPHSDDELKRVRKLLRASMRKKTQ